MSCDRKIGPFSCCSVVQGDCLELMKQLPDGCVDAVITDPPYGIGITRSHRLTIERGFAQDGWDDMPASRAAIQELTLKAKRLIIWGGNYFELWPSRCFLVWDKCNEGRDFADCEMAWTNFDAVARIFRFRPMNMDGGKVHPTQKPIALMEWCIEAANDPETILDPYCGSGSTLIAAKKLGRHFLGFEISGDYCQIARERLARIDAQPSLFEKKPEQLSL